MTQLFGAGIWHFASYVDRYATDGYAEPIGMLDMIDRAGEVRDASRPTPSSATWQTDADPRQREGHPWTTCNQPAGSGW